MVSLENQQPSSLRVMRFGFEPNPILQEQLQEQLEPTRRLRTPLRLYASSQLLISLEDYYDHEEEIFKINQGFSAHRAGIGVIPKIDSKRIEKSSMTRIGLQPSAQDEFDALLAKINLLPNRIKDQPKAGHYIFVDVATDALLSGIERDDARDNFAKVGKTRRYAVEATRFVIQRDINPIVPIQTQVPLDGFDDLPTAV